MGLLDELSNYNDNAQTIVNNIKGNILECVKKAIIEKAKEDYRKLETLIKRDASLLNFTTINNKKTIKGSYTAVYNNQYYWYKNEYVEFDYKTQDFITERFDLFDGWWELEHLYLKSEIGYVKTRYLGVNYLLVEEEKRGWFSKGLYLTKWGELYFSEIKKLCSESKIQITPYFKIMRSVGECACDVDYEESKEIYSFNDKFKRNSNDGITLKFSYSITYD